MQVQHEAHLIEANPSQHNNANLLTNGHNKNTKSLDYYTLSTQTNSPLSAIEFISSCPINNLVAVHLANSNQLVLYDTRSHQRRDRFPLKACDKRFSRQSFQVSGLDFSQDGQRLAVAQTDCIIYIYKFTFTSNPPTQQQIGTTTTTTSTSTTPGGQSQVAPNATAASIQGPASGETTTSSSLKPTITGKFAFSSPISCLIWCDLGIIFGSQDGRVKLITMSASHSQHSKSSDHPAGGSPSAVPQSTTTGSSGAGKVINIFAPQRPGPMPISLAHRSPLLLAGLTDHTIQILLLLMEPQQQQTTTMTVAEQTTELSSLSTPQSQSRRNSGQPVPSVGSVSVSVAGVIDHSCPPSHLKLLHDSTLCCCGSDGRLSFHSIKLGSLPDHSQVSSKSVNSRPRMSNTVGTSLIQTIDLKEDIMALDYSAINEVLAVATKNRILFVKYDQESRNWRLQSSSIELLLGPPAVSMASKQKTTTSPQLSLTSLIWTRDGSQLVVGCSSGCLELFRCIYSKQTMGDQLDICHIAKNRVRITDRERNLLATYKTQSDIKRVNLLDTGQSVIIWTLSSLLLARLNNALLQSEIQWNFNNNNNNKNLKFLFVPNSAFVLLFSETSRELKAMKLGANNNPKYSHKFQSSIMRSLISLRQFPWTQSAQQHQQVAQKQSPNRSLRNVGSAASQRSGGQQRNSTGGNVELTDLLPANSDPMPVAAPAANAASLDSLYERLAFVDPSANLRRQINIIDLRSGAETTSTIIQTENDVISLEFSCTSRHLIFRDFTLKLYLVELQRGSNSGLIDHESPTSIRSQTVLLDRCHFAGWLPATDCLVAQSGHTVQVWFDLGELKRVYKFDSRSFNINMKPPLVDMSLLQAPIRGFPIVKELSSDESDQIKLTNGQCITLNSLEIRFYSHLINGRLGDAYVLLERQTSETSSLPPLNHKQILVNRLYSKLGWLLISDVDQRDCELALRVFTRLGHKSLCKYLADCCGLLSTEADNDNNADGQLESELRLAKLCGQWDRFESLAEAEPERIVATYKRLNKWRRCLDYLTRQQQFRQRDIAEQEHVRWLISRSRHLEAATIQASSSGDLAGALEMLLAKGLFSEAAQLFLAQQKTPLSTSGGEKQQQLMAELARRLQESLMDVDKYLVAAELSERVLGDLERALELYVKAHAYEQALDLINASSRKTNIAKNGGQTIWATRKNEIQFQFAAHLESQYRRQRVGARKAAKAIELYLDSQRPLEAFKLALDLKLYDRAFEMITSRPDLAECSSDEFRGQCRRLAEIFKQHQQQVDRRREALRMYELADDLDQVIELLIDLGQPEQAFEVALKRVHSNDRQRASDQFIELARGFADRPETLDKAERIYLLLERPELAIDMYREVGHYDKMLELIGQHRQAELEGCLLQLARQLEAERRFEEAEKYLLRASPNEWTSVVRMYRLAGRWPDAYRVARANCTSDKDPLLVQLAYWWARSLLVTAGDPESSKIKGQTETDQQKTHESIATARQLLIDLNVLKPVIEFCCETNNFNFAIDLSKTHNKEQQQQQQLTDQVVLRYAKHLEHQHKFDRAEQVLIDNNQIEAAVRMYLDNDKQTEAIALIERQLQSDEPTSKANNAQDQVSNHQPTAGKERLVELLNATLIECANRLATSDEAADKWPVGNAANKSAATGGGHAERLQAARQMYLRAQRPELAIEMYRERGMWQEAIQVAQRFAPRLLESIERALDDQVSDHIEPILRSFPRRQSEQKEEADVEEEDPKLANEASEKGQKIRGSSEGPDSDLAPFDQMRVKVESSIRSGEDRNAARLAFSGFLAGLTGQLGDDVNLALIGDILSQLDRLIGLGRAEQSLQVAQLRFAGLANDDNLARIYSLADVVFANVDWQIASDGLVWVGLRQTLEACWCSSALQLGGDETYQLTFGQESHNSAGPLERRLLATHFVALHAALAHLLQFQMSSSSVLQPNGTSTTLRSHQSHLFAGAATANVSTLSISRVQELSTLNLRRRDEANSATNLAVDLLSKLSLSLLRYTDLLDCLRALYYAGLWQVAAGRLQLARIIWSLLIEMADATTNQNGNYNEADQQVPQTSRFRLALAELVDLPERVRTSPITGGQRKIPPTAAGGGGLAAGQLAEVRQWLLETLIERRQEEEEENDDGGHRPTSDRQQMLSSKMTNSSHSTSGGLLAATCLVSGLPALLKPNPDGSLDEADESLILGKSFGRLFVVGRSEWSSLLDWLNNNDNTNNISTKMAALSGSYGGRLRAAKAANGRPKMGATAAAATGQLNNVVEFLIRLSGLQQQQQQQQRRRWRPAAAAPK